MNFEKILTGNDLNLSGLNLEIFLIFEENQVSMEIIEHKKTSHLSYY